MITAPFAYHAPTTLREAIRLLRAHRGEAKILGGGMSLIPLMKLRLAQAEHLVDVGQIADLTTIRHLSEDQEIGIGAAVTYQKLQTSPVLRRLVPVILEAASQVGDIQVRNRGTIGGACAHADPAADLPAALLALEAKVRITGGSRSRLVTLDRFIVDAYTTTLGETECITEILVQPPPRGTGWSYTKFANKASRFAIVGVAALLTLDRQKRCRRARVAITGAGPRPVRARATERKLLGKAITQEVIAGASRRAHDGVAFLSDVHASKEYRQHLVHVITARALTAAAVRATPGAEAGWQDESSRSADLRAAGG